MRDTVCTTTKEVEGMVEKDVKTTAVPGGVEIGEMENLYCPLCGAKIVRQTDFFLDGGDPELGRCPNCEPEEWLSVDRYVTYLQFSQEVE